MSADRSLFYIVVRYLSLISHELIKHLQEVRSNNTDLAVMVVNQVSLQVRICFGLLNTSVIARGVGWGGPGN